MLGPLFGAVVLAVADWRAIFAINLVVGLVLAAAIRRRRRTTPRAHRRRPDLLGLALSLVTLVAGALVFVRPPPADARPDLGRAVRPVRRRRPLADALGVIGDRAAVAARGPLR